MNNSTLLKFGGCALLTLQACTTPVADTPWDHARTSRVASLAKDETQVRGQLVGSEEDALTGAQFIDAQYGVTEDLTLGISLGQSLRRVSALSDIAGEEVYSMMANYEFERPKDEDGFGRSAQLQVIFKDEGGGLGSFAGDSDFDDLDIDTSKSLIEFRPSFGVYKDNFSARAGVNLQSRLDPQFQIEGAYWHHLGEYFMGTVELDAGFGDFDEAYVSPGVVTQLRDIAQLQVSFPIGLNSDADRWQALVGLIFAF
jgi:hypothetical protein